MADLVFKSASDTRSEQVTGDFIQLGLENLQGGSLHNLLGSFVPLLVCPHGEKVVLTSRPAWFTVVRVCKFCSCQLPL